MFLVSWKCVYRVCIAYFG